MKENDIVTLKKTRVQYENSGLYQNVNGIVLKKLPYNKCLVLFLNDKIAGDWAVVEVDDCDLKKENVDLPMAFIKELRNSNKLNDNDIIKKCKFRSLEFKECDYVELLVEDEKYSKFGIHKGERGVIAIDSAVDNSILVDFSGVDANGNFYGDCIAVKLEDLKLVEE